MVTSRSATQRPASQAKTRIASRAALGRYLAAGLGASALGTVAADAAPISLDIANLGGTSANLTGMNGGTGPAATAEGGGDYLQVDVFPTLGINGGQSVGGNNFAVANFFYYGLFLGFFNPGTMQFATTGGPATPNKFTASDSVGPSETLWNPSASTAAASFRAFVNEQTYEQNDWGSGSFLGFRVLQLDEDGDPVVPTEWHYGYFEVTWNKTSLDFRILSGAYESTPNTPITPVAVPEPSTMALMGIAALALGAGAIRRSRKTRRAGADGAHAETG